MTLRRRSALLLLLASACALPACNSNGGVTLPSTLNAVLAITVDPTPVVGTQNALTFAVSAPYKIHVTETNGLGGELVFVSASVYNPTTGAQVALQYYDSADLTVFVGQKRLEAKGELVVTQTMTYTLADYTKAANMTVTVQMKDDRSNLITQSILVKIE
jgi:hypothetical protein